MGAFFFSQGFLFLDDSGSTLSKGAMEANRHLFGTCNRHFFNKLRRMKGLRYKFKEILRWIAEGRGLLEELLMP